MDALDESFNMASFVETGRDASVKDATLAPSDAARNHEKPEEQPSVISSVSESSFKTVFTRTWKTLCWLVYQRRSIRKARKSRILDNVKQCECETMGYHQLTKTVEQHPLGFPRAAAFFDSDEHFMIYRRFGVLFSRLLLNKQDELVELEELLSDMDDYDDKKEQNRQYLRDRFADESRETMQWTESRKEVLQKIEKKALEYSESRRIACKTCVFGIQTDLISQGELLLRAQKLVALKCPSAADHDSAMSFMENDPAPFNERERAYIYQKQDLVTLKPGREDAWLDVIIERSLKIFRCRFLRVSVILPNSCFSLFQVSKYR